MYGGITDIFTYFFGSNKVEKGKKNKMRSISAMSEDYKRAQMRKKRKK